ncbi:MAG: hypothetical protein ACKPKO_36735, partial [Candidatus Fonsibacter sp.]
MHTSTKMRCYAQADGAVALPPRGCIVTAAAAEKDHKPNKIYNKATLCHAEIPVVSIRAAVSKLIPCKTFTDCQREIDPKKNGRTQEQRHVGAQLA